MLRKPARAQPRPGAAQTPAIYTPARMAPATLTAAGCRMAVNTTDFWTRTLFSAGPPVEYASMDARGGGGGPDAVLRGAACRVRVHGRAPRPPSPVSNPAPRRHTAVSWGQVHFCEVGPEKGTPERAQAVRERPHVRVPHLTVQGPVSCTEVRRRLRAASAALPAAQALRAATAAGAQAGPAPPSALGAWLAQAQQQLSEVVAQEVPPPPYDLGQLLAGLHLSGAG